MHSSTSYIKVPVNKVIDAANETIEWIYLFRKNRDFKRRQEVRYARLRLHKFWRKITLGIIKLPLYSYSDADRIKKSHPFDGGFYPCSHYDDLEKRCNEIIKACKLSSDGLIRLSVDDANSIQVLTNPRYLQF